MPINKFFLLFNFEKMKKKVDPILFKEVRKQINETYINKSLWVILRKILISIDFWLDVSPINNIDEKKRLKNRLKRKRKRKNKK